VLILNCLIFLTIAYTMQQVLNFLAWLIISRTSITPRKVVWENAWWETIPTERHLAFSLIYSCHFGLTNWYSCFLSRYSLTRWFSFFNYFYYKEVKSTHAYHTTRYIRARWVPYLRSFDFMTYSDERTPTQVWYSQY
jgi:hypothetical protein